VNDEEERGPPIWPVYAVTAALVPGAIWLVGCIDAMLGLGHALILLARGEIGAGDISIVADNFIGEVLGQGVWPIVIGVLANSGLFGSVALIAALRGEGRGGRGRARLRLDVVRPGDAIIAAIGLLALTSALDAAVELAGLEGYGRLAEMKRAIAALDYGQRALLSIVVGLGAGVAEELYFRGYMLTRLQLANGPFIALALTSLVFGLFHLDPVHSPLAALMGLYLGLCALISGSLYTSIVAHIVNNVTASLFPSASPSGPGALAVLCAGLPLSALTLYWLWRRRGELRKAVW
jgi:membrane protease YdiL (CAAX protease family)